VKTGDPVVSSPAYAGVVVVIGSGDGAVYGLDPSTGNERWRYLAEGAVEAPVTAEGGVVYVASRSGELTALEAKTGKEIWTSPRGEVLRTAPAVSDREVFVVDDSYGLLAFDRRTGKKRWGIPNGSYVGPPLVAGGRLMVARNDGNVERLDFGGEREGGWYGAAASNPLDGDPTFSIGPAAGGAAVWVATDRAAVFRLGHETGPARIEPTWADEFSATPFFGDALQYTAVGYRGKALLLGSGNNVYLLDARNGEARKVGALTAASGSPSAEPVVASDTLLVASGDTLHAVRLPDLDELWKFEGGSGNGPPVVAGQRVLWPSTSGATLSALDLDTGEATWKAPLPGAGGVIVGGDVAFANPASAFDLDTGKPLWSAETGGASGGPALDASGDVLFAGTGGTGSVAAFDAGSGEEIWRTGLGDDLVKASDRL
jgi:outer membrane protein assembly factor BamB